MLTALQLLLAIALQPAEKLAAQYPGSRTLRSADGQHLVHASGFLFETGARGPEQAARSFLAQHGAAFGVAGGQELLLAGAPAAGEPGAVRFRRAIAGLPVFGGDLVVGVDAQGRVFVVNSGRVAARASGRHALGNAAARAAATASVLRASGRAGSATVTAGWRAFGDAMRAVYRVDFIAHDPPGDWRVYVDGESGKPLFRENLRDYASAQGRVLEVSPVETAAALCPVSGETRTTCASPVTVTLPNLATGANLAGTQTTVYNCGGADAPDAAVGVPGPCTPVPAVGSAFNFSLDTTYSSATDGFAAAMAYYHLDKHVSFLKRLDPTLPPASATQTGSSRAVRGSLPALVNAHQGGVPLENAFYSGLLDAMVFGQGAAADYTYDATVMYHELTHGAVFAWGGFDLDVDALGAVFEPKGLNEGTADAMAVSETGRSAMGTFLGGTETPPRPYIRDMDDPAASRTCQGDLVPGTTRVSGLSGEEHQDGEIWNGFYWEVYQGLKTAGLKGCNGTCEAGPAIQYKTMQLAGGTIPTFASYWQTFKSAATALFPSQPAVATYIDCVAKRRKLDKCDRTVPVFAGESKVQFVQLQFSPFQVTLQANGATQFAVCSGEDRESVAYWRKGEPVKLSADQHGAPIVTAADFGTIFRQPCSGTPASFNIPTSGTWYVLLESADGNVFRLDANATGIAARPTSVAAPTCALPSLQTTPPPGGGGGGCSSPGVAGLPALATALAGLLRRRRKSARPGLSARS